MSLDRDQRRGVQRYDPDGHGDGRRWWRRSATARPLPTAGQSVTVHGHLDGDADLMVVELRGRRDEHDPQPQPRLRVGRVLHGEPDRDERGGI
ncbi:MAG: hypothetical protein MZU91_10750 [Desulfosudis oleivorans]|nr:hypothetical protein [Desulfosudis oleivorans]